MPAVKPYKDGNWSDVNPLTSPWYSGTVLAIPDQNDDVFLNGKTINLDVNVKLISLVNRGSGNRTWKDGSVGNSAAGGTVRVIGSRTIEGFIVGAANNGSTITLNNSSLNTTIIGTLSTSGIGSTGGYSVDIQVSYVGRVNVVGDLFAAGDTNYVGPCIRNLGYTNLYVTGTLYGGGHNANENNSGLLTQNSSCIYNNNSYSRIYITGDMYGGPGSAGYALNSDSHNLISIVGNLYSSARCGVFYNSSIFRNVYISGNVINHPQTGRVAIRSLSYYLNPVPKNSFIRIAGNQLFFTTDSLSAFSMPPVSSVRFGTTFANNTLTGTCVIPQISAVSLGVPVDQSFGISILNVADLFKTNILNLPNSTFSQRLTSTTSLEAFGKFLYSPYN